jgi:hypothetical protein
MRRRQANGQHGGEMARLAWCRKDLAGLRERQWRRIEELQAASAQRRRRRWFAAPAATWDAAERSLLGAKCGHEIRADRVTPSVRGDRDLGPIAARDRDCCPTESATRTPRAAMPAPTRRQGSRRAIHETPYSPPAGRATPSARTSSSRSARTPCFSSGAGTRTPRRGAVQGPAFHSARGLWAKIG